ncbi:MAG: quinone oxidoreductase [Rhodospirillaceae bacterium]
MTKAILVQNYGGPEVMKLTEVPVGDPGPGEIRIAQTYAGVNYIDTYHRTGLYKLPPSVKGMGDIAMIPGSEGAGKVAAVGPGVNDFKVGDRVAYGFGPVGGYAAERLFPAEKAVKIPDGISDEQAAAMMLRGLTVWYLLYELRPIKAGETVVCHAAAGGIGLILAQWAKHLGIDVIGTVGSEEKAKLAKDAGCRHVILYKSEDWVAKVKELTGGKGVSVVFDGVGKDTFAKSLDCLMPRGLAVAFGNASGPAPAIDPLQLAARGSLMMTRPRLGDFVATRADLLRGCEALFAVVKSGAVKIDIGQTFALADAAKAHIALESRQTTGSTVLRI